MANISIPVNLFNVEPCQEVIRLLKDVLDNPLLPPSIKDEATTRLYIIMDKAEQKAQEVKNRI